MKSKFNIKGLRAVVASMCLTAVIMGCQPDEFSGGGNGLTDANLSASFTITPVSTLSNTYVLKADETGLIGLKWDKGDGSGFPTSLGKAIDTVFYPDAGTYSVKLQAYGRGGASTIATQTVTVAQSDPTAGNLVVGGKMQTGDESKWTFVTYTPGVTFAINDGKMVATGGSGGHAGIYQAVQVEGGKKYKVDMTISGSGATDVWYEVYVGMAAPEAGKDYNDGGKRLALNTWAGCGKAAFSGKLSAISCDGKEGGVVTFAQSGTAYLFIRGGGANLGTTGISITDVELRGVK